jgi:hypothetical protein
MIITKQKKHLKAYKFNSYLTYLYKNHRHVDVEGIIRKAGLTPAYLENPNNWVSLEFNYNFQLSLREYIKDENFAFKATSLTYGMQKWGAHLSTIIQGVPNIKGLMKTAEQFFNNMGTITKLELQSGDSDSTVFKVYLDYEQLTSNKDKKYAQATEKIIFSEVMGMLVAAINSNQNDPREGVTVETIELINGEYSLFKIVHDRGDPLDHI